MLEIINLRHGSVVNHTHGRESGEALELLVEGVSDSSGPVKINGVQATCNGKRFAAVISLKKQFNEIKAETANEYGAFSQTLKVVWDKASFKRYNFFIDDHSFFFTEIAKERPKSLFDHFYLKFLREMNLKYGMKVTLNCFYRNDHHLFELRDFPDVYKQEWIDNSDWLRLAFHSYSEFPDRPYQNTAPAKLAEDYDLLKREIIRIAGEETFINPIILHWYMARPDAFHVLAERGVRVLDGQYISYQNGTPVCDIGYCRNLNDALYLDQNKLLYDFDHNLLFIQGDCTCNLVTPAAIPAKLEKALTRQTISLGSHEQYSYPGYHNYQVDHHERIETALRLVTEHGYKPVFFAEGFLGNTSWGK